jgi:single-strand DNA-binding protein
MAINKVILVGNVGKDCEVRFLANGGSIASFTVATSESWKDKNTGEKAERTEWHNVVVFGKLADIAAQYVSKGRKVYIEGKLKTDKYEKDGVTHYMTKIIADTMQLLDKANAQDASPSVKPSQSSKDVAVAKIDDEDIPF